jgi:putative endonuclease
MDVSKTNIGNIGEDIACEYLKKIGYKILERNFRIRGGEIDIIAKDKDTLVFVEVKMRSTNLFGTAKESIVFHKITSLKKCALSYNQMVRWEGKPYRFDLVAIDYEKDTPKIELIQNIIEG